MAQDIRTFVPGAVADPLPRPEAPPFYREQDLRRQGVQPPAALWVDPDDVLILKVRNSLAGVQLQVSARLLVPNGRINTPLFTSSPTADRSINSATENLYQGWLLAASVQAIGATLPTRGQTYCVLRLDRGLAPSNVIQYLLGADYVSGTQALEWPFGRNQGAIESAGVLRSIAVTAPAAGAEFTQTVPTAARWGLRALRARLVTSATVANRRINLLLDDGANTLAVFDGGFNQVASSTQTYTFAAGHSYQDSAGLDAESFIPPDQRLLAGWRISSTTLALQAADQYSAIRLLIEEWLED